MLDVLRRTATAGILALGTVAGLAFAANAQTVLRVATDSGAAGSPSGDAIANWAKAIEEGSNGAIEVRVFYQEELGNQLEVFGCTNPAAPNASLASSTVKNLASVPSPLTYVRSSVLCDGENRSMAWS